jgi:predicted component of type VI protein secretion system
MAPDEAEEEPVDGSDPDEPSDEEVVRTAAEAAEGVVFARYKQSDVRDLDVTVTFEDGVLEADVYLDAPDDEADPEAVADEAARTARDAVDGLFDRN